MPSKSAAKVSRYLLITGLLLIAASSAFKLQRLARYSFASPTLPPVQEAPLPTQISIPALELTLPLAPTEIVNGIWQISDNSASYLAVSARPGTNGAIIIYAHNKPAFFGRLPSLKPGDLVTLITQDGQTHPYTINETLTVTPKQVDALNATTETLILYTCTGFADTKRFIVKALPSQL